VPEFTEEMQECIDFIDSVALIPTITPQFESLENSILIYPNPVRGTMNVQLISQTPGEIRIELCDLTGRVYKSLYRGTLIKGSNRVRIHVQPGVFSHGLNILRISTHNQVVYRKLVVAY
ncbi:MAG: T9SS type A sorting domain-containing protein, partial [Bacteroidetes bacterium]|nr:T9SS type A sorting domain-containing protein [Bacteroidota bacterium]